MKSIANFNQWEATIRCVDQLEASIRSIDQWEASIGSIDQWEVLGTKYYLRCDATVTRSTHTGQENVWSEKKISYSNQICNVP